MQNKPNSVEKQNPYNVECYSGMEYAERPRAFIWQGRHYRIMEVQDSWRAPDGKYFRVYTDSNQVFCLFFDLIEDSWTISPL